MMWINRVCFPVEVHMVISDVVFFLILCFVYWWFILTIVVRQKSYPSASLSKICKKNQVEDYCKPDIFWFWMRVPSKEKLIYLQICQCLAFVLWAWKLWRRFTGNLRQFLPWLNSFNRLTSEVIFTSKSHLNGTFHSRASHHTCWGA